MSYCKFIRDLPEGDRKELHKKYHDTQYGFPIDDDNELFGRLILEINQAGLSWETILKKEKGFRVAYKNFNILKVSKFKEQDIDRLMNNKEIIRNKLKINAAIENAKTILKIQKEFGSFEKWIFMNKKNSLEEWIKLFKKNFRFTGGEIVKEFLMSIGYLKGSHDKRCYLYKK